MHYDLKWAQEKNGICEGDNASFVCETETGILYNRSYRVSFRDNTSTSVISPLPEFLNATVLVPFGFCGSPWYLLVLFGFCGYPWYLLVPVVPLGTCWFLCFPLVLAGFCGSPWYLLVVLGSFCGSLGKVI